MNAESRFLLEYKNLEVEFGSGEDTVKALKNISFTLSKGETVGIVGESGSGKSVTALSTMRLLPGSNTRVNSGQIFFSGESNQKLDLLKLDERQIRKIRGKEIAMIFQEPMTSLNPVMRCGDQVAEVLKLHLKLNEQAAKNKVLELFEEVKLPRVNEIYRAYPHQLSGGQKQRVMIALAISCNPSVLIADEPTTALDVTVQEKIVGLMKDIQRTTQMGMIFITHDLGLVGQIADRILVMYKGSLVEQGTVYEIFENAKHPYTKGLLACKPPLNKRLLRLPSVYDFMESKQDGTFKNSDKGIVEIYKDLIISESDRVAQLDTLFQRKKILQVENLECVFANKHNWMGKPTSFVKAVNNVSFDVFEGETLGLVGESGCGKTTLGRAILRLMEPFSGKIIFEDKDITKIHKDEMRELRKKMQIIFQDPYSSLNPRMTVGECILEPMQVHGLFANKSQRKEKVMELLTKVNLSESHYNRYPHEFSGGQRQRVCIARTLALSPKFIVCDEMVSALDVSVQAQVLNLLTDLKKEFLFTYIFISHDLSVVKFMSDRVMVMEKGEIREIQEAEQLYQSPKTAYTKQLIDSIPAGISRRY
jgi:peptide/nickel transport system ATP-binding protein